MGSGAMVRREATMGATRTAMRTATSHEHAAGGTHRSGRVAEEGGTRTYSSLLAFGSVTVFTHGWWGSRWILGL